MKQVLNLIDQISEFSGKTARWFCVLLIFVFTFETVSRYVFNAPTNWVFDFSWMLGASIIVLGWSYTHLHHGHIRIDVIYNQLSRKTRAILDIFGNIVFLFPVLAMLIPASYSWMLRSWETGEVSLGTTLMLPMAPIKTVVFIGIILFALQGIAEFIRVINSLAEGEPND